jgi:hypothetical protein
MSSGYFIDRVTGLSTPYEFSANSGSGEGASQEFEETILPDSQLLFDLIAIVFAESTVATPGSRSQDTSLTSTFSITNTSLVDVPIIVGFTPSFQYEIAVSGTSNDDSGLATTTLSNALTGSFFIDMIDEGVRASPVFVGPDIQLATLGPGQSIDITAGFTASSIANKPCPVPAPLPLLGLCAGFRLSRKLRTRTRRPISSQKLVIQHPDPENVSIMKPLWM